MTKTKKYQQVKVDCNADYREILMAEFAAIGFDSFQETTLGFISFVEKTVDITLLDTITSRYREQTKISYVIEDVDLINWN